jgi:VIT1/CCC1 family predicted Fe2+/Mn2+ transporter
MESSENLKRPHSFYRKSRPHDRPCRSPARVALTPQDYVNAFVIFVLVSATAVPGVIPFFVFKDVHVALRISNFVLILLLFIVGYRWAQYTDAVPWQVGLGVTLLGVSMVCVAIALGG